jgi:hypothetical protein
MSRTRYCPVETSRRSGYNEKCVDVIFQSPIILKELIYEEEYFQEIQYISIII